MTTNYDPSILTASVLRVDQGWNKQPISVYRPKSRRHPAGVPRDVRIHVGDRVICLRGDRALTLANALVDAYEETGNA